MKSILQKNKECYFCGRTTWLEEHHIFGAVNRSLSEKYGLKVWLCHNCHNEPPNGVHHNQENNLWLKRTGQKAFESLYDEDFLKIFGRNYK